MNNGVFNMQNILQRDPIVVEKDFEYSLKEAFEAVYRLTLIQVFLVLCKKFNYTNQKLSFVCTVP